MKRISFILLALIVTSKCLFSQTADTLEPLPSHSNFAPAETATTYSPPRHSLYKKMIFPALLTAYGFIALGNEDLKEWDTHVKKQVWDAHPHQPHHFDDWLEYMPGFSVYVLNGLGIQGKSSFLDANRQYLLSSLGMAVVVQTTKHITKLVRPDGYGHNAFPSGHTAVAFVAAEFLNQEYKGRSFIIPALGYTAAATVGYMRLYNNKHWFKDIISGAGIGMGITRLVYWYYPRIKQKFWPEKKPLLKPAY